MGDIARVLNRLLPAVKAAAPPRTAIPVGTTYAAQPLSYSYEQFAREGYGQNELVYAAIEVRATSAAEPVMAVWQGDRMLKRHPALDLLQHPNPFMTSYQMTAGAMMYRDIAGNAFLLKVRSAAGRVVELWPLRPDRMLPVPDRDTFLRRWDYRIGAETYPIPLTDIIHFKTRNPLNEFLGMPPLLPIAARIDVDNWMRQFVGAFFRNAGVPAGLLNIQRQLDAGERELLRNRWRSEYAGPEGWHNLLVIDNAEAKYEPMGMPIGPRGLVVPDMNNVSESRILMPFQVPLSMIGAVLGMASSSYANRRADASWFWEGTLAPIYRDFTETLTNALQPDFPTLDRIGYDLSTVRALQEDTDKYHDRLRADMESGAITQEEFRDRTGYGVPPSTGTYVIKSALTPIPASDLGKPPESALPAPSTPSGNGKIPANGVPA
jgi:HK97 family phage portal protein